MLGLRLGMTFDEAEALIRTNMKVKQVVETAPPSAAEAATPAGLFHGKMFVADDRPDDYFSERIAIFDAPPQASGRVVAIERIVYIDAGLWDRASEQLVARYGPAAQRQSMSNWLVWIGQGEENCLLRQSDSHHRWRVAGSTDESRVRGAQLESPMAVAPNLQAAYQRCGPTIEVIKGSGGSGADGRPLDGLHTRLYDAAVLARLLRNHAAQVPSADALPMKF
jgi:hypothetical protein